MSESKPRGSVIALIGAIAGLVSAIAMVLNAEGDLTLAASTKSQTPASVAAVADTGGSPIPPAPIPSAALTARSRPIPPATVGTGTHSLQLNSTTQQDLRVVQGANHLLSDCASGVTSACQAILTQLIKNCSNGAGASCDLLYRISPAGSAMSAFSATCGYRRTMAVAGKCEAL